VLPTPTSFRPESLVGTTLDGRYRLVKHLASGGMGSIFSAEHVYMRKELALKVLRPDLSTLPDIAERFRREAQIAASLEHDNIVRVTDFGRSPEGWLFLAMELLEGESLFERLRRSGPLMPEETIRILVQVCHGLDAAHARGVVHRDLKPENIFLVARPAGLVKILDFGIAKLTDPQIASDTQAGMVVGTPEYLSPEQALGGAVDARADVYAVGLIAWRMLAGYHPFKADDARGLLMMQATRPVPPLSEPRPDLLSWPLLLAAIARACDKDIQLRPASAAQLANELEACLGPSEAVPVARTDSRARSHPALSRPHATPLAPAPSVVDDTVTLAPDGAAPTPRAREPARAEPATWRSRALDFGRAHRIALALGLVAALLFPASVVVARWLDERPVQRARQLLDERRPDAARDLLAPMVLKRPGDARLRVLQGRALHGIPGQAPAGVEAYEATAGIDPFALGEPDLALLAQDLTEDRKLAERAAKLLARLGSRAVPAVAESARSGPGTARLRALDLLDELGADASVDRVGAYVELLADPDCDVKRAAARRLGDLGSAVAVPKLTELARQTREIRGLFGKPQSVPACSAVEAEAALKRIQSPSR
jgi:serine/threonine-protein kinase